MNRNIQYYVEGQNEKTLTDVLKSEMQLILPGKVDVLNVLTEQIKETRLRTLRDNMMIVLIFDTDVEDVNLDIFNNNLTLLRKNKKIDSVVIITQVKNIEDELIRSTDVKVIRDLLPTKTDSAFKRKFNEMTHQNVARKLGEHKFDIALLWSRNPSGKYEGIFNNAGKIKIKK